MFPLNAELREIYEDAINISSLRYKSVRLFPENSALRSVPLVHVPNSDVLIYCHATDTSIRVYIVIVRGQCTNESWTNSLSIYPSIPVCLRPTSAN